MKHFISFLVITSLLFISCRPKTQSNFQSESSEQTGENYSLPKNMLKK